MNNCIFCPQAFGNLKELVAHLVSEHKWEAIILPGHKLAEFKVYQRKGRRIQCFCGKRFTCFLTPEPAPYFQEWAIGQQFELDEYTGHLAREGGLQAHLQTVKEEALLERVATGGGAKVPVTGEWKDMDDDW